MEHDLKSLERGVGEWRHKRNWPLRNMESGDRRESQQGKDDGCNKPTQSAH